MLDCCSDKTFEDIPVDSGMKSGILRYSQFHGKGIVNISCLQEDSLLSLRHFEGNEDVICSDYVHCVCVSVVLLVSLSDCLQA